MAEQQVLLSTKAADIQQGQPDYKHGSHADIAVRWHASIANYAQALQLRPNFVGASLHLGIAWQRLGEWEKASACFRQVVTMEPRCGQAYNNLGNALKGQGRLTEACSAYEQALRLLPDTPQVLYNLGIALHELGKLDQAAEIGGLAGIFIPDRGCMLQQHLFFLPFAIQQEGKVIMLQHGLLKQVSDLFHTFCFTRCAKFFHDHNT